MRSVIPTLLLLPLLAPALANGQTEKASLKGIEAVCVVVDNVRPENTGDLTSEALKKTVEVQLKKAGIRSECRAKGATLRTTVHVQRNAGFTSSAVQVRLEQEARLVRTGETVVAGTWSSDIISGAPAGAAYADLKLDLTEVIDRFVSAVGDANR